MPELTKATYTQRRNVLIEQIRLAKDDHGRAALNAELGKGGDSEVAAARETVSSIEDRVIGLDAAWDQAQAEAADKAGQQERAERLAAAEHIRAQYKARKAAMAAIVKAMAPLSGSIQAFRSANDEIVKAARPYSRLFGRDGMQFLRSTTHPDVPLEQRLIAALLYEADINVTGIDGRHFADMIETQTLDGIVEASNREIERLAMPMMDDEIEGVG